MISRSLRIRGEPPAGRSFTLTSVSEKRHRQQQRRQARKVRSRSTESTGRRGAQYARPSDTEMDGELAEILGKVAEFAVAGAGEPHDARDAEEWASGLAGTWRAGLVRDADADQLFGCGLVRALEDRGGDGALATLRALAAVGAESYASLARQAADRLARAGVAEPPWIGSLDRARPAGALLMCEEDGFDDGVTVIVEFRASGEEPHTVGIYIDHNMGGLVKDVFLAGSLRSVSELMGSHGANQQRLELRELDLAEARARVERALDILDHALDPPVNEEVRPLRALINARMATLPVGGSLPDDDREFTPEDSEQLLAEFVDSPEGQRWSGDEVAQNVAELAIEFGVGYNHGGPLRWSPVVVEIFMTSWLARKATFEQEFFERVPEVLRDWVKFAGHRRGIPAAALREAVTAVKRFRNEMLESADDPDSWGPAKAFAMAAKEAGVDMTDPDAIGEFIERMNEGLTA